MADKNRVYIFDTTLRDGEQTPGVSLNREEKLEIALALKDMGVDIIEAGFPITSRGDFEAVSEISRKVKGPCIAGLARALRKDIETAWEAVRPSSRPRIHTFIATSPVHMKYKLQMTQDQVLETASEAVQLARKICPEVEFSCEDALRSDRDFLVRVVDKVIENGAGIINIPDTVGYAVPGEIYDLFKHLIENVKGSDRVIFSSHCHNDLGLAVSNSLSAIKAGARQAECAMNGLGERAGNAALEEIVMALKARKNYFRLDTKIKTEKITAMSRLVARITGIIPQPNKAIVGNNAFAHGAGIHQDGVIKKRTTYEIIDPKDIGLKESKLVLGKLSGRHALKKRMQELGYELTETQLISVFGKFKELADKKKEIFDEDLAALLEGERTKIKEIFTLVSFQVFTGNTARPYALVRLKKNEEKSRCKKCEEVGMGDGPVDAALRAMDKITGIEGKLLDYGIRSVSSGKDAIGEVRVKVNFRGEVIPGKGNSTDVIEASILAYLDALNRFLQINPKHKKYLKVSL